jgi:hypothetical protein
LFEKFHRDGVADYIARESLAAEFLLASGYDFTSPPPPSP